ncbi:hypothetical protein KA025_00905 [Candidatus Saccharibacteria bacterium]|jgi:diadenosine tetraphosphate (Ap4A) HIT family hydrolase|nr:hypothetical protein [Candidatus Saccharibacteria bacterium]MBP7834625.1 hypothetical protein [Candidatus Saccharibacteria bacterium]
MYRNRKARNSYTKFLKTVDKTHCPFCEDMGKRVVVEQRDSCYVIENDFPYSFWDQQNALEHLMIVPKRHVGTFNDLNLTEQKEIFDLMSKYESDGYDIFARGINNATKTVPSHQHTHVIKTSGKHIKSFLFLKKPYFVISK